MWRSQGHLRVTVDPQMVVDPPARRAQEAAAARGNFLSGLQPAHSTAAIPQVWHLVPLAPPEAVGHSVDVTCALHVSPRDDVSRECIACRGKHKISLRPFADLEHTELKVFTFTSRGEQIRVAFPRTAGGPTHLAHCAGHCPSCFMIFRARRPLPPCRCRFGWPGVPAGESAHGNVDHVWVSEIIPCCSISPTSGSTY